MLSKPKYGWTDFKLEGTSVYELSYLDDIAFEWIDQATHGLETMQPFCVKGFLEPRRLLCMVSYWNCYIVVEDDENVLEKGKVITECSHISMLEFCKFLYQDIHENITEWASFVDYGYDEDYPLTERIALLQEKLNALKNLLLSKEECFADGRFFL